MADDVQRVRSVALIGQGDVGKTTLGEALLFITGAVPRLGSVLDGTTALDSEPEEIKRQISLTPGFHHFGWKKHEVSLVDTPGYANFLPETRACLRGVTGAVLVLSPTGDLKVEAERVWEWAREEGVPLIAFVNRLDRERADLATAVADLTERLGAKAAVLQLPIGRESGCSGIVDLLSMKAWSVGADGAKPHAGEIPGVLGGEVEAARNALVEAVAEADDALLERYLEDGTLATEDVQQGLVAGVRAGKIIPVLCGIAPRLLGVEPLLDAIVDFLPAPSALPPAQGDDPRSGDTVERAPVVEAPFSAFVFKTVMDPFVGKLSVIRVLSGKAMSDATVYNASRDTRERLGSVLKLEGKKQTAAAQLIVGEIGAIAKLKDTMTGDTLCDEKAPVRYPGLPDSPPVISFAVEPKTRADEDKAVTSLRRLAEEDPALVVGRDEQTREILLSGAGQNHIETVVERLKRKYGVEVLLKAPKVPYKETIRAPAKAQGKYKKQTGGRGQYGDTWIAVEPMPRGGGFEFVSQIVGGVIPRQYVPAVEKGIRESLSGGVVAGYPMVDVKVTLYDGSYHDVDSSEMAFKIAGSMGFKNAIHLAKPTLLEPIMTIEVSVPAECVGDVIGDLNSRRGRVLGVEAKGASEVVRALVPMAEVLSYAPDLRSMTSGRGGFRLEFAHYENLPAELTEKVVKDAQAARQEEKESK